jgi:hypothetical protein
VQVRLYAALLVGGMIAAGAVGACGLDENGLLTGDASLDVNVGDTQPADVQVIDVVQDVPLPPTCATTDTSCFGLGDGGLPEGWSPYVYVPDGGACPSVAFTGQPLVTNTQLTGGCACSCTSSGFWECPYTIDVTGGTGATNCNPGHVTVEAGVCQNVATYNLDHIEQTQATSAAGNGIACDGGSPSSPTVSWNDVTLCAAGCDAGTAAVCGATNGLRACIAAEGVQTCPGSLTRIIVGGSADPSCNGCSCTAQQTNPTCTAVAHLFWQPSSGQDTDCTDAGGTQDLTLSSSCQAAQHAYDSYFFTWNDAGPVTCTSGGGGGDAGLTTPKTVCCTN